MDTISQIRDNGKSWKTQHTLLVVYLFIKRKLTAAFTSDRAGAYHQLQI